MQLSDREQQIPQNSGGHTPFFEEGEGSLVPAWAMLGVLVVGKIAIMIAMLIMMPTSAMVKFLAAYNWSWIILVLVLGAGPSLFWWRLWRVRRKRARLVHAEWQVD